jgi:hypothetical protein
MKFKIEFDTDNAAFDGQWAPETARILRNIADKIENGKASGKVLDENGNTVGQFGFYTNN